MQVSVTFKNIEPSERLKSFVQEKLSKFDKFFNGPAEANVILSTEKFRSIVEVSLSGDRLVINGKEETEDIHSAVDLVVDKLEKQIKKNKQKIKDHHRSGARRSPKSTE
ncbi:MAG: ribosome-associated translation inhibitor RaiA [Thermodesulfobacteriota bacterium]